jgi:RND family efflux transporter MFP subunit
MMAAACSQQEPPPEEGRTAVLPVRLVRVEKMDLKETVDAVGSLAAAEEVTVRPEISAILKAVHFREGESVKRGQLLFSLEEDEIRQRLVARRAALKEAVADTENVRKIYLRRKKLLARNVIAPETFDEVRTRYETATAREKRLEAEIRQTLEALENTEIRSPIDGIAGVQRIDPGDFVERGDPLVTIVQTDILEIEFTVADRYANRVHAGQKVRIRTASNPGKSFDGAVSCVSPRIRENTRHLLLKARIDNP